MWAVLISVTKKVERGLIFTCISVPPESSGQKPLRQHCLKLGAFTRHNTVHDSKWELFGWKQGLLMFRMKRKEGKK